ncbi:MAG: hypothetical protein A2287_09750 [Candidatus Melainabacteria bacterium RIFOXYA12_FULL_32_12]|nr:MAG: hypothetical protein A2287_09750 [Candidatus Melainabacteria bacterium RIFOXYA12_FULL_32_12]
MELAPIVLFVYKRLEHLKKTVNALKNNFLAEESELIIFSDAAKDDFSIKKVQQVRDYIKSINGFKTVTIIEREQNCGLANNIISGVTEVVNKYGKIIVLEDDLVTSKYFLKYMNDALDLYENEEDVISISGYFFDTKKKIPETFFLRWADCWGWATWKRGWDLFESDGEKLLQELTKRKLLKKFNINNSAGYIEMLKGQIEGTNDSWAVRWYASAFINNKLTLCPGSSLVFNVGCDGSGTHCDSSNILDTSISNNLVNMTKIPVKNNLFALKQVEKFFRRINKRPFLNHLKKVRKYIFNNIAPPIITKALIKPSQYGFFGNYNSWKDAKKLCTGYEDNKILEKVKESVLKVKNGEAIFERDSFILDKIQYSFPVLAGLLKAAVENDNKLSVLDFGGSLGSHYFQNRQFLAGLKELKWNVVEQQNFVKTGREYIQDDELKFYYDVDNCIKEQNPNLILISGVIQYLENPYIMLENIISKNVQYIFLDRTTFCKEIKDLLTVQKIHPSIYEASYPAWFLDEEKFLSYFTDRYNLITDFDALGDEVPISLSKRKCIWGYHKGFIFERRVKNA